MYAKKSINYNDDIPPWKIIILDEADTMTSDSQFALRRIMEEYSKITRFCIICNYHDKIIEPIISRCALFCFKPINPTNIVTKLEYIVKNEKCNISTELLDKISFIARGDLRKAINLLQNCNNSFDNKTNEKLLYEFSGLIPENEFNKLFNFIINKDLDNVTKIVNQLHIEGYSIVNQILLFHNFIIKSNLTDKQKSNIIYKLSEVDQNLIKGCDEYIQFIRLVYYIVSII